ncbi:MAG: TlyA family RNA methyltransferase [Leptospiraceae bacterium]|nr:TlyA family RNA methyltransferase [Leptospiraceae bacterium]
MAQEKIRLDDLLVERGLAESRTFAQSLILSGSVLVDDQVQTKSGFLFSPRVAIRIKEKIKNYVSRAAHKLLGALQNFPEFPISSQYCIDLGASTGGFTQVLLEKGANKVLAVDVGYGQLEERIRQNQRVEILDRFHFKNLQWENIHQDGNSISITADLSFISIENVFLKLQELYTSNNQVKIHALLMVKPQFELGGEYLEKGIVKDKKNSIKILLKLIRLAREKYKAKFYGISRSNILGTEGNQEYFIYLSWGL